MSIIFMGGFPPPYGGVTTKNRNLLLYLTEYIVIEKIDFNLIKRKNVKETVRLISSILNKKNQFIIGVAGRKTRKNLCRVLYIINRKAMKRSLIFLMGGAVVEDIRADTQYQKYIKHFKCIYAETKGMVRQLEEIGITNVEYYPNCRARGEKKEYEVNKSFSCVFFSLISKEKGVDIILNVAEEIPSIKFYLYGEVSEEYTDEFYRHLKRCENVTYKGVFRGNSEEVYNELRKYSVLLLPTRWKAEGVPGILIEAKIAGVPAIVSNQNFNAEIVKNGQNGIVIENCNEDELKKAIITLNQDISLRDKMSSQAIQSAEEYYIDRYIPSIVQMLS